LAAEEMKRLIHNSKLKTRLFLVAVVMFGFGYALVPLYEAFCEFTGINVLALGERDIESSANSRPVNTQVDKTRTITVEFDSNVRGPWYFKPEVSSMQVHPGEMSTVTYRFQNMQDRRISAQAIPSYAPLQAAANFHKLECFCFREYTLDAGESKSWPVVFVVDPKLSADVTTITLSYTFFEVGGKVPAAPVANSDRISGSRAGV
jgi:cytochrome c oxidase assembly protein subunit 11